MQVKQGKINAKMLDFCEAYEMYTLYDGFYTKEDAFYTKDDRLYTQNDEFQIKTDGIFAGGSGGRRN